MTATLPLPAIDAAAQRIQEEIGKRLKSLKPDAVGDLMELTSLLQKEEDDREKMEIVKTMMEIIFPKSITKAIVMDERVAEMAAARERLDNYRRKVGEQIKALRESLNMTQDDLAAETNLPQSHISRLEQGKHAPTFATMERIAKALNTTPDQLDPGFPND
jgi:ribosome-binding protein aMBF1 (putative translation factor)